MEVFSSLLCLSSEWRSLEKQELCMEKAVLSLEWMRTLFSDKMMGGWKTHRAAGRWEYGSLCYTGDPAYFPLDFIHLSIFSLCYKCRRGCWASYPEVQVNVFDSSLLAFDLSAWSSDSENHGCICISTKPNTCMFFWLHCNVGVNNKHMQCQVYRLVYDKVCGKCFCTFH